MTTIFAEGSPDRSITEDVKRQAVRAAIAHAGDVSRTLALPPDATRIHSDAGTLTRILYEEIGPQASCDVMPALGTHFPMEWDELRRMFGDAIPLERFCEHRWREDLVRLGAVPSNYVHEVSGGVLHAHMPECEIPVEVNRRLVAGGYTAIFSLGQVVPHEVIGMANGVKNVLVGAGGQQTINRSHFLGAAYGMERIMGRAETPVRDVLNYGFDHCLSGLGIIFILTVMEQVRSRGVVMRGIFVGDDHATFLQAAELSRRVNVTLVEEPQERVLAYLEPAEFKSTWLGNKAVYRTRMMMADGGELTVLAPGVKTFGEDPEIDRLIRRYGYRGTPATVSAVGAQAELRANLSAAAHLIHGSSEGRFRIVYATDPSLMSRREVEGVGFEWRNVADVIREYDVERLSPGPNEGPDGPFYYVDCPALGLWAVRERFETTT
jgi:nickel-dependent lactate racemase